MIIMVMDCTFVICFIYDGISGLDFLLAIKKHWNHCICFGFSDSG